MCVYFIIRDNFREIKNAIFLKIRTKKDNNADKFN